MTTISTFTHTSHNSSTSIIIPRETNDSYDDLIKIEAIAKRAIRVSKQARETEARIAIIILEPESTDKSSIRPEENSQTLDELELRLVPRTSFIKSSNSDLNSLQSETNEGMTRMLEEMPFMEAIEHALISENSFTHHLNDTSASFASRSSISEEIKGQNQSLNRLTFSE